MELSKLQREIISRGTAFLLGLGFAYLALGCYRWASHVQDDVDGYQPNRNAPVVARRVRSDNPVPLPYGLLFLLGGAAFALCGFAVVPISVLHRISPETWRLPEDDW